MRLWSFTFAVVAAIGFGLAAFYAEGQPLVGINVGAGVFAFTVSLLLKED